MILGRQVLHKADDTRTKHVSWSRGVSEETGLRFES